MYISVYRVEFLSKINLNLIRDFVSFYCSVKPVLRKVSKTEQ